MNKTTRQNRKRAMFLVGLVSNQELVGTEPVPAPAPTSHKDFPEIEQINSTFSISVKDDEGNVIYENKTEPYSHYKAPSLVSLLKFHGAKLDESQQTFIEEGLKGSEETGKAVQAVIDILNEDLKATAKSSAYAKVFNTKKPKTEQEVENAQASFVRNYLKFNPGVSDETAIQMLTQFGALKDYTVADYRANKGKR